MKHPAWFTVTEPSARGQIDAINRMLDEETVFAKKHGNKQVDGRLIEDAIAWMDCLMSHPFLSRATRRSAAAVWQRLSDFHAKIP